MGSMSDLCLKLRSRYSLLSCESITKRDGSTFILIRSLIPDISGYLPSLNAVVESGVVKLLSYHGRILKEENFVGGLILEQLNEGRLFFCIGIESQTDTLEESFLKDAYSEPSSDGRTLYRSRSCSFFLEDSPGLCFNCQTFLDSLQRNQEDRGEEITIWPKDWNLFTDQDLEDEGAEEEEDSDWAETKVPPAKTECPKCSKALHVSSLSRHLKLCCKKYRGGSLFTCKICLLKFSHRGSYNRHSNKHASVINLDESVDCPLCKVSLESRKCLNSHIHESHEASKGCCVICFEVMPKELLPKHIEKGHSDCMKRHMCTACGVKFKFPYELKNHIASTHDIGGDKFVVCEQCGKGVAHRRALLKHIWFTHNKSNVFPCTHCNKVFFGNCQLQKHIKIHSDVKPFKCAICSHSCVRKDNVRQHIRRLHKKEPAPDDILTISTVSLPENEYEKE